MFDINYTFLFWEILNILKSKAPKPYTPILDNLQLVPVIIAFSFSYPLYVN